MFASVPTIRRTAAAAAVALVGVGVVPLSAWARADDAGSSDARLTREEEKTIRKATQQFRDVEAAMAAGFLPTEECAELPGQGAMGYHYVNPAHLADGVIDPTKPEILLYIEDRSGKLRLAGVEYFAADGDQDLTTDDDRPVLFDQPFDGPMPGHEPTMPVHYDLHVWLYEENPEGQLAPWNPAISCPSPGGHH